MAEYIHEVPHLGEKFNISVSKYKSKIHCHSTNKPYCDCLTNMRDLGSKTIDEHFPSLSPCPYNCRNLKHCDYHQKTMILQTKPELVKVGINCIFCHINEDRKYNGHVKDFILQPFNGVKEVSYGPKENSYRYLSKYNIWNISGIMEEKSLGRHMNSNEIVMLPQDLVFDEVNMDPKAFIGRFVRVFQERKVKFNASVSKNEALIFIINGPDDHSNDDNNYGPKYTTHGKYIIKLVSEKFKKSSFRLEVVDEILRSRYDLIMGMNNEAGVLHASPKIHGYLIGIDERSNKDYYLTDTFILMNYVNHGRTLQMLNNDFIQSFYVREVGMPSFDNLSMSEKADLYYRLHTSVYDKVRLMHSYGLRHGDLNPGNIILRKNEINHDYTQTMFIDFYPRTIFIIEEKLFPLTYIKLRYGEITREQRLIVEEMVDILIGLFYHRWSGETLPSNLRVMDEMLLKNDEMSLEEMKVRDGTSLAVILQEAYGRMKKDDEFESYFSKMCKPFSTFFDKIEEVLLSKVSGVGRMTTFASISDYGEKVEALRSFFSNKTIEFMSIDERRAFFLKLHDALFRDAPKMDYGQVYKAWGYTNTLQPVWTLSFIELMSDVY